MRLCGGLILMWSDVIRVTIQNYSHGHINALISMGRDGVEWKFSGFMGIRRKQREKNLGYFCNSLIKITFLFEEILSTRTFNKSL
jgi:hypothetical protein